MYSLILLNGGTGSRALTGRPKQFAEVHGRPLIAYALTAVESAPEIGHLVVNHPHGERATVEVLVDKYCPTTAATYVEAGGSRQDSVRLMLPHCRSEHVILHESARPMVDSVDISRLIAEPYDNVGYMRPIPFTVAPVDPVGRRVTGTLDRDLLRNVQLPQKFRVAELRAAHDAAFASGARFSEDATLCRSAGFDVRFLDGKDTNVKVTGPTDIRLVTLLLEDLGDAG